MKPSNILGTFRRLWPVVKKYRAMYAIGLVFLLLTNAAQLLVPQAIRQVLDHLDQVQGALILLGASALVVALGRGGWRLFIVGASRRIERDLRRNLFHHLTLLEPAYYARTTIGDLMARATNDLDAVRMSLGMSVITFIDGTFMGVGIISILLATDLRLGFLTILPLFLLIVLMLVFGKTVGKLFERLQAGYSDLSRDAQESLTGLRVIQSFARESHFAERFSRSGQEYLKRSLSLARLWGLFFPIIGLLSGVTTWILLWVGGGMMLDGALSPGLFAAYLGYLGMLVWPMMSVGMTVNMVQRGAASLKRILEIMDTPPGMPDAATAAVPEQKWPLEVRGLSFSYSTDGPKVLSKVDFTISEGEVVGILGATGSGKTTLLKLITRLLDPPPGTVFLGGRDVRDWPLGQLRARYSLVPQNPFLFSETLRDNMTFANLEAPADLVETMAETSGLARDLTAFPEGWQTMVGERGVTLSGGQKQRAALARALLGKGDILILDDALSAVDTQTEEKIVRSLLGAGGRTLFVVSHRISTLLRCQRVMVLDEGRVVQDGPPRELLSVEGVFSETAALQHVRLEDIQ